jgi:alanyl-tRNA synthetase
VNSNEIRALFLRFFQEKGHEIIPSSSLVPKEDPTLLLTSAGMVQIKPYFLGEAIPPNLRLTSCQKCFRTTDIESVGDTTHLTFFEMLGNFSVGDYFKPEAISWAWEFVTERLGLSPERLWITIFLDDDEAFDCWRKVGVPEERILRFGEEDNFWGPAGESGPCGPCSEIHYDFGEGVGCGKSSCAPNCGCARFSEIWNLVFTQYNQDREENRIPLARPNIDTGMGLERTAAVMQGKTSVYETDLFTPLLEGISKLAGKKYGVDEDIDNAMRIVVEHVRGIPFLIADGVVPSNDGRGYVLRRLLRRAALFGHRLGLDKAFLAEIAKITIGQMGHIYPEIEQRRGFISEVAGLEEVRFGETLNTGLELLDGIIAEAADKKVRRISGKQAFKLYDTYGFPLELTSEVAAKSGFSVDVKGFEREMERQRERGRGAQKFDLAEKELAGLKNALDIKTTPFTGYEKLNEKTTLISLLVDNDSVEEVGVEQKASLILESTPFYGEMGGQAGDTGEMRSSTGRFLVTNTIRVPPDIIVHQGKVVEGYLSAGDEVEAVVDKERRLDIARNHTATHLLQSALRQVLGEHVQQRGSLVMPERFTFDFSHIGNMTKQQESEVQHIVNDKIRQNLAVYIGDLPYKQAVEEGAIALFDEKYGDVVRVVKIGKPAISTELCGGTHVAFTGEIGFLQIVSESSIGSGLRRIEAVTGRGAEKFVKIRFSVLEGTAQSLDTSPDEAQGKAAVLTAELSKERKRRETLERELAKIQVESLAKQTEEVKGIKVLAAKVPSSRLEVLREMSDLLRMRLKSAVIVLGTVYEDKPVFLAAVTEDLVAQGYNAGDIVKQVARITGGGGGGKARLAQAGGKYKNKVDEALSIVKSLVQTGGGISNA